MALIIIFQASKTHKCVHKVYNTISDTVQKEKVSKRLLRL